MQRHDVASTLSRRCINAMCPLGTYQSKCAHYMRSAVSFIAKEMKKSSVECHYHFPASDFYSFLEIKKRVWYLNMTVSLCSDFLNVVFEL